MHDGYVPVNVVLTLDRLFPLLASRASALADLATAAAHKAYHKEVQEAGGLWTATQVNAALKAAPKL